MDLGNFSILNLMPPNIADDRNVKMAAEAFDKVLADIIKKIPDVAIIPNLVLNQIVNETLVDLLAWQFHVDFYQPDLPLDVKISLVKKSLDWHTRKGTPLTIQEIVTEIFAEAHVEEWYEYNGLPHHFRVRVGDFLPDSETIAKITRAINSVKNTRSFLDIMASIIILRDVMEIDDKHTMVATIHSQPDSVSQHIFRNGRVLRDGKTVFNTQVIPLFRNNFVIRNGMVNRDGMVRVPAVGTVFQPVYRHSGIQDRFGINFGNNYTDNWKSFVYRNGAKRRNGAITRTGNVYSMNDTIQNLKITLRLSDTLVMTDQLKTIIRFNTDDSIGRNMKRDGSITRNRSVYRSSNGMVDPFYLTDFMDSDVKDELKATDVWSAGMRYHYFRDNTRLRNGTIQRKGMIFIPLE